MRCWARSRGDCCDTQSGEHYFSATLFTSPSVRVRGFSWCKNEDVEIPLSKARANLLCKRHNEMLSPVDVGGGRAFGTLREAAELTNVRRGMRPRFWMVKDYKVKGLLLERWFLKTMINLVCLGDDHVVWEGGAAKDHPPAALVDYCYGDGVLGKPRGLHALGAVGMDIQQTESVTFSPVFREAHLVAGIFMFRGYHFLLSVSEDPLLTGWAEAGGALRGKAANLLYHPKAFETNTGGRRSHIVKYTWK